MRSAPPPTLPTGGEPLRAGGEWVYPVPPLSVPAVDVAAEDDPLRHGAVRLFIERARAAEPRFAPNRRLIAIIAASAGDSTVFRWPSSWQERALLRLESRGLPSALMIAFTF